MSESNLLALLAVIITTIGVLFVAIAYIEFARLRKLRLDFDQFKTDWQQELFNNQKAQQRIIASYQVTDINQKIVLLESAIAIAPTTFNGYNALGYAHLENDDQQAALDAFLSAVNINPNAKEGYFDAAYVYMQIKRPDLAKKHLANAVKVDATAQADIDNDPALKALFK